MTKYFLSGEWKKFPSEQGGTPLSLAFHHPSIRPLGDSSQSISLPGLIWGGMGEDKLSTGLKDLFGIFLFWGLIFTGCYISSLGTIWQYSSSKRWISFKYFLEEYSWPNIFSAHNGQAWRVSHTNPTLYTCHTKLSFLHIHPTPSLEHTSPTAWNRISPALHLATHP